ncbi:hypothetical protein RY831_22435 [Noviherbaspirillum sp. CPCC 100848]|uniref:Uncharacterized protein n=1 Tax=Noviherbaspirillum album TaxID=3080276 RepID=A0ABU6JE42_9BURK|nr:hypothetical protein [Noviherbaspirillum sp. CPCC 100848]MEC4721931.1 hypothetical protein [Noviherbaspirillum sp. CPCC 100848]
MEQRTPHQHSDYDGDHQHPIAKKPREAYAHIPGWGADLDHKNRPAYPMERTPPRLDNVHWTHPENQPVNVKVYHSTERPGITPVFGTSTPPAGVSGMVRGVAYKLSENDIRHWLLLLLADRINVVEGIGEDLKNGHVPNVFAEMGIRAEYTHNPGGLIRKALIASAVLGAGYYLFKQRQGKQSDRLPLRQAELEFE